MHSNRLPFIHSFIQLAEGRRMCMDVCRSRKFSRCAVARASHIAVWPRRRWL